MKKYLGILLVAGLVFSLNAAQEEDEFADVERVEGPSMYFSDATYNFGEVEEGTKAKHIFRFMNNGDEPVVISRVRPSCGCTVSEYTREPVQPGEIGEIHAEYNSSGRSGNFSTSIRVNSNAGTETLRIRGVVN